MNRWKLALAFLGMVLVSACLLQGSTPNVTCTIDSGCTSPDPGGSWSYTGNPCAPGHDCSVGPCPAPHYCGAAVTFNGSHNQDGNISVTATEFTYNDGTTDHTLSTWIDINGTEFEVTPSPPDDWSTLVPITWTGGTWSLVIDVGFKRSGYADLAATYVATVTVTCSGF